MILADNGSPWYITGRQRPALRRRRAARAGRHHRPRPRGRRHDRAGQRALIPARQRRPPPTRTPATGASFAHDRTIDRHCRPSPASSTCTPDSRRRDPVRHLRSASARRSRPRSGPRRLRLARHRPRARRRRPKADLLGQPARDRARRRRRPSSGRSPASGCGSGARSTSARTGSWSRAWTSRSRPARRSRSCATRPTACAGSRSRRAAPGSASSATPRSRRSTSGSSGIIQIESPSAVEHAAEIAAIDGVDVLFVGPTDLSHSLGVPGRSTIRRYLDATRHVVAAAEAAGKAPGSCCATRRRCRATASSGSGSSASARTGRSSADGARAVLAATRPDRPRRAGQPPRSATSASSGVAGSGAPRGRGAVWATTTPTRISPAPSSWIGVKALIEDHERRARR